MSLELNEQINYEVKQSSHPSYRYTTVLPQSNQSETLLSGATVSTQIEIPSKVFNFAVSTLDCRQDILSTALEFTQSWAYAPPIDSIVLTSREGVELVRVDNADIYAATVNPYVTPLSDFLSNPKSLGDDHATLATAQAAAETTQDRGFNFFPNGEALADATPAVACGRNGTRLVAGLCAANDMAYTEMQYFRQSTVNENVSVNFSFPLAKLAPHTLFSVDKDFYFGQNLLLYINWSSKQNCGFATTSATNMATDLAVVTANITINNIRLRLAVETNQQIANVIMSKVNSEGGMKLMVPYVRSFLNSNSNASTNFVHQQKINLTHGQRLLQVYNVLMHITPSLSTRHDKSNLVQIKTSSLMNQINSFNLTENRIDLTKGELWEQHREIVKGSCIQGSNVYAHNECNILSFRDGRCVDWLDSDCVIDGIDLSEEQTIAIDRTTVSAGYRSYMFVVTQKMLSILPGGSIVMQ